MWGPLVGGVCALCTLRGGISLPDQVLDASPLTVLPDNIPHLFVNMSWDRDAKHHIYNIVAKSGSRAQQARGAFQPTPCSLTVVIMAASRRRATSSALLHHAAGLHHLPFSAVAAVTIPFDINFGKSGQSPHRVLHFAQVAAARGHSKGYALPA